MPVIAEAQALLETLWQTEEVKAAEAQRQRRLHLQTAYGQAMMYFEGVHCRGNSSRLCARQRARGQDRRLCGTLRRGPR